MQKIKEFECHLYAGMGNNIFQIMAVIQTAIIKKGRYHILVPPTKHKDHNKLVLGGHEALFLEKHVNAGLPHPTDLPSIFPNLTWKYKTVRTAIKMTDDYPFAPKNFMTSLLYTRALYKPCDSIQKYLNRKYLKKSVTEGTTTAIHFRVPQKADNFEMANPSLDWYADAIEKCLGDDSNTVFVVSGDKKVNNKIIRFLKGEFPDVLFKSVYDEPWYVDFFLIAAAENVVCTNSTFSYTAGLISKKDTFITPSHLMSGTAVPDFVTSVKVNL
jgi:hypothetical protein